MTAADIFREMSAERAAELFGYLQAEQKALYAATIDTLAKQRKLRPVFVERKARPERYAWLKESVGRRSNEGVAAQLLQVWLVGRHRKMLCDFLDALGVPHDEDGTVASLPPEPAREVLEGAVERLLAAHPAETVGVYLRAFVATGEPGAWEGLAAVVAADGRLALGAPAAPAAELG